MRGVASIRTETHLRRFLHGIRLFCNAHSPPKTLSPPKATLQSFNPPYCRWQYGLLSPYFAALNTGSCYAIAPLGAIRSAAPAMCSGYALARIRLRNRPIAVGNTGFCRPISLRSIRALATLFPLSGQYAPPLRLCARAMPLRAYAYATRPIAVGNTGQSNIIHPIHIKMII